MSEEELKILHHDEVQLIDYGESRTQGPFIKLRLKDPEYLNVFRGMDTPTKKRTGHILNVTIAEGDITTKEITDSEEKPANDEGPELARLMEARKVWENPKIWDALCYNQTRRDAYRRWVATKNPCYVSGFETDDPDQDDRHPHHWKDQDGSTKPPDRFCIPLRAIYHTGNEGIHNLGVKTWLKKYQGDKPHPKYVAQKIMAKWNRHAFKDWAGISSMRQVTREMLNRFHTESGVKLL